MALITIARELGATNRVQENALAEALGLRVVHREHLEKHFQDLGVAPECLHSFDEKKPGVASSFFNHPNVYWETLRTAILREAMQGNAVFIGRGVNFMLHGITACLRFRCVAPKEVRIKRIAERQTCSEDQAAEHLEKSDRERMGFCYYFYGQKWHDAHGYDFTVNTAEIDFPEWSAIIAVLQSRQPKRQDDLRRLHNAWLCQEVRYKLLVAEGIEIRFLNVVCDNGNVTLEGNVVSSGVFKRVEECLGQINGIQHHENRLQVIMNDIPKRSE